MWILAANTNLHGKSTCTIHAETSQLPELNQSDKENLSDSDVSQCKRGWLPSRGQAENPNPGLGNWWQTPPAVYRMDDAVAFGVDRLKAIGNGQVPVVAARAFLQLEQRLTNSC